MATRQRFTAGFEARVALEALREEKTVQAIAVRRQLHPNQVGRWKRKSHEGLADVFERSLARGRRAHEKEIRSLPAKIGQLVVERDS